MKKIIITILFFMLFSINVYAERIEVIFNACVDGDTFKANINNEKETIRLLAIDTPETVKVGVEVQPYGKEASDLTCDKLKNANKIEIEYDSDSDKKDKYDRLLAWVYVDDIMLQKELINKGYAKVAYIYGDYMYTDELFILEKEAAKNKLGIWSEEEYISSTTSKEEDEEETFIDELKSLVSKYIKKWFSDLVKDMKKEINKAIKSIFN